MQLTYPSPTQIPQWLSTDRGRHTQVPGISGSSPLGPNLCSQLHPQAFHCSSFLERLNLPPSTHTLLPSFAFLSSLSIEGPHFISNPRTPWGLCLCDTNLQQDLRLKIIHLAVPSLTSAGGKVAQRGRLVHCGSPITHLCLSGNMASINSLPQ